MIRFKSMKRTKEQQTADGLIISEMRQIITALLREIKSDGCFKCGKITDKYQIHHKRYGDDITINDLELLCIDCHYSNHGKKRRVFTTLDE